MADAANGLAKSVSTSFAGSQQDNHNTIFITRGKNIIHNGELSPYGTGHFDVTRGVMIF